MKFSGKIEDGTSNEPLNFGSDPWPWQRLRSPNASSYYYYYLREKVVFIGFGLSVSNITQKVKTDFDEIFRKCQKCNEEQVIRFW